jgi:maltose O-acetyltransferase
MMTEQEKGEKGMLYDPDHDANLKGQWRHAQELYFRYNQIIPTDTVSRDRLIREILGKAGKNIVVLSPFYCDRGKNISIGDNFFSNMNFTVLDDGKVTIGNNVFIAPNVGIYTAGHPLDKDLRNKSLEYAYPVTIGNDVWIGAGVSILPGVTIGDNVVIGAGSLVNRDIPSNSLAVGNPCRVIRKL